MFAAVDKKLRAGDLVILDGGTGTEIERRGVRMDDQLWCAMANLHHPDVIRGVHADYIDAGADVITANTYASSPVSLLTYGRENELAAIDRAAVKLAREAAGEAGRPIAIAGSFSVMPAVEKGTDRSKAKKPPAKALASLMKQKAEGLAEAGADLIIMEMMRDVDVSLTATEAAVATGLPVWVGIAVERNDKGELVGYADNKWPMKDIISVLMSTGAEACLVMHHEVSLTPEAINTIRTNWAGPIGVYPESGHFEMPSWKFGDLTPEQFVAEATSWRNMKAQIIGGCCGITPDHIALLAKHFNRPVKT